MPRAYQPLVKADEVKRVLLFGDQIGIPQVLDVVPPDIMVGVVCAEIRPGQHVAMKKIAARIGLPLLIQPRATSERYREFVEQVRLVAPDLIVVSSYSMLLPPEVLNIPSFGGVNIHGALLPEYRGANPTQWALLAEETETGVTIHHITPDFDAGDIIAQRRVPIYFNDTWRHVQSRIASATKSMLAQEMPKVLAGNGGRVPQDESAARYHKRRRPEHGLIDWKQSVRKIYNLVRSLVSPHPGAFYFDGPDKVVLDRYHTVPEITSLKYGAAGGGQLLGATRLVLKPLTLEDIDFTSNQAGISDASLLAIFDEANANDGYHTWFDEYQRSNGTVAFTLSDPADNRPIGFGLLGKIDYRRRTARLEVRIRDDSGHLNDAVCSLLEFAFQDLDLRQIYAHLPAESSGSIQTYNDVGFSRGHPPRQASYSFGTSIDPISMAISRCEYVKRHSGSNTPA